MWLWRDLVFVSIRCGHRVVLSDVDVLWNLLSTGEHTGLAVNARPAVGNYFLFLLKLLKLGFEVISLYSVAFYIFFCLFVLEISLYPPLKMSTSFLNSARSKGDISYLWSCNSFFISLLFFPLDLPTIQVRSLQEPCFWQRSVWLSLAPLPDHVCNWIFSLGLQFEDWFRRQPLVQFLFFGD